MRETYEPKANPRYDPVFESLYKAHRVAWQGFDRVPSIEKKAFAIWRGEWGNQIAKAFPEQFLPVTKGLDVCVPLQQLGSFHQAMNVNELPGSKRAASRLTPSR